MSMKMLTDYTDDELVKLADKEIAGLIDIECMDEGAPISSVIPDAPQLKEVPAFPKKDVELFCIGGYIDLKFKSIQERDKVLAVLRECETIVTTDYNYNVGSENRYIKRTITDDDFEPSKQMAFSYEAYLACSEVLTATKDIQNTNNSIKRDYEDKMKARNKVAQKVYDAIRDAHDNVDILNEAVATLKEYVNMAGGDLEVAKGFFEKLSRYEDIRSDVYSKYEELPTED